MRAGNNLRANIWRYSYPSDDEVGGAQPSGTVVLFSVEARMQDSAPIAAFAIQGQETNKVHIATVYPGTLDIREFDQFEPVSPPNHPWVNLRFRIDTVQRPNYHPSDPRGMLILTMVRDTRHGTQFQ